MFTKEDDRAVMFNLSFNRIADELRNLDSRLKDYITVSQNAIVSTDKQATAMRKLTWALVFVGIAQVIATLVSVFV